MCYVIVCALEVGASAFAVFHAMVVQHRIDNGFVHCFGFVALMFGLGCSQHLCNTVFCNRRLLKRRLTSAWRSRWMITGL